MNKTKENENFLKASKSIQSTIFAAVSVLVLCAVLAATAVSVRYTNSTVYENSAIYTQTIIHQLNQNVDSYITYMGIILPQLLQKARMRISFCTSVSVRMRL